LLLQEYCMSVKRFYYILIISDSLRTHEHRLKQENQILKIRADKVDGVLEEIAELKKSLGLT
jgi:hypothetical protein